MTQTSMFWNGTRAGDAATWSVMTEDGIGYHMANPNVESPWVDRFMRCILNGDENRGILKGYLGELEVTGVASPVSVDTGASVVYGLFHHNNAAVSITIPTPTVQPRYDLIVVRRNWATRAARITRIAGTEGGGVPSLAQSAAPGGSGIWDIPLAIVEIDILGNITITDTREDCQFRTVPIAGSIDTQHLTDDSVGLDARATYDKWWPFIDAMGIKDCVSGEIFTYSVTYYTYPWVWGGYFTVASANDLSTSGAATWNGVLPPSWNLVGNTAGLIATFKVPPLWVADGGTITPYVWWQPNQATNTMYLRTAWQAWSPSSDDPAQYSGTYGSTYISGTRTMGQTYQTAGLPISDLDGDETVIYFMQLTSASGDEGMRVLGIELRHTGYAP